MKKKRTLKRKTFLRTGMGENCFGSVTGQPRTKKEFPLSRNSFLYTMKNDRLIKKCRLQTPAKSWFYKSRQYQYQQYPPMGYCN